MNRDLVKNLEWDDPHAYTLNKLYTLFQVKMSGLGNLSDLGYEGFAEPIFEDEDIGTYTPDFLALGTDGDALIIDVKGFRNIEEYLGSESEIEDKIKSVIEDLEKYQEITPSMVREYLSLWDISTGPEYHELTLLIPHEIYNKYDDTFSEAAIEKDIILWILDKNSSEHIWLEEGEHRNSELNDQLRQNGGTGVLVYQGGKDFIRFSRDTNKDIVRFFFVAHMTSYCSHEDKLAFYFDEIDDILVQSWKPPMFGHLPPSEREDIWMDCMNAMLDRFNLVSRRETVRDSYEWNRTRFLNYPPHRYQIIQNVGEELGILEEFQ